MHHTATAYLPLPTPALNPEDRILLKAARLWVMLARSNRSPRPALAALLGRAGPSFHLLMEQLIAAWPDPFTTYPPCALAVSPDEQALLTLVAEARDGAAAPALADMLAESERARLALTAARLEAERAGA
jgi:hypothetical protein